MGEVALEYGLTSGKEGFIIRVIMVLVRSIGFVS